MRSKICAWMVTSSAVVGLVGDQDIGLAGQRHGDHDALAHAAGEFIGILLHPLFRLVDIDEAEHLDRTVPRLACRLRSVCRVMASISWWPMV